MFTIKAEALVALLEMFKGKTFAAFDACTIPKLNKKGRVSGMSFKEKFGLDPDKLRKYSHFSAGVGYEYAYVVMNRLIKDGASPFDYQPGETWHEPYQGSTVIRQKKSDPSELYFFATLICNNPPKSEYRAGDLALDKEALAEFLPVPSKPTNQGLGEGREVEVRTFKLRSIQKLRIENAEYEVIDCEK